MRFDAAIMRELLKPLEIEELECPPLEAGQVLVKIYYSGVCRSQLMEISALRGEDKWLPHLLGHEASGVVIDVGYGVTKVVKGDEIVVSWIKGEGMSSQTPQYYDKNGFKVNAGPATTFSTISILSEDRVFLAPKGFDRDILALFGCALLTGGGMALNHFKMNEHREILILGFGGVGSAAAVILEAFDSTNISIIDSSIARRNQAIRLGFENVFSGQDKGFSMFMKNHPGFDLCIESAGSTSTIELGFSLLKKTGSLVFASHPEFGARISIDPFELIMGKTISGSFGGDSKPDADLEIIAAKLRSSKLNLRYLLGEVFDLHDINLALNYLELGEPGRAIIKMPD